MKDTGGTAFPAQVWDENSLLQHTEGMTLRDYFAAKAMQGFVANGSTNVQEIAQASYIVADAMLKARGKE
jgi:hypothetical protein